MKKSITTAAIGTFAVIATLLSSNADAQVSQLQPAVTQQPAMQQGQMQQQAQVGGQQQIRVVPGIGSPMQNQYYFGMQLQLVHGNGGATLRVVSVTPGSPASHAGLEYGDEIRTVNGQGFSFARDSFDAVAMMNRFVDTWTSGPSPGAPAVAAATAQTATTFYPPVPAPAPQAQMIVRNVRTGQDVYVTVRPHRKNWGGGGIAPAQAAPAYSTMRATGG